MEMLNKYPNATSVEDALDKGLAAYSQAEENKTDILLLKESVEKLENLPLAEDGEF